MGHSLQTLGLKEAVFPKALISDFDKNSDGK